MAVVGQVLDEAWVSITGFFESSGFGQDVMIPVVILVVVGIIGGRIFSELLSRLLKMSGMDDLAVKADVQSVLRRFGYRGKFSDLFADIFRYFVYVVVGLAIFNLLGIESFL